MCISVPLLCAATNTYVCVVSYLRRQSSNFRRQLKTVERARWCALERHRHPACVCCVCTPLALNMTPAAAWCCWLPARTTMHRRIGTGDKGRAAAYRKRWKRHAAAAVVAPLGSKRERKKNPHLLLPHTHAAQNRQPSPPSLAPSRSPPLYNST